MFEDGPMLVGIEIGNDAGTDTKGLLRRPNDQVQD